MARTIELKRQDQSKRRELLEACLAQTERLQKGVAKAGMLQRGGEQSLLVYLLSMFATQLYDEIDDLRG